ncbi:rhodanese-like domain-containing protein [bacterium]|nr:rhodanese-like domain-containing protein [bacterium]
MNDILSEKLNFYRYLLFTHYFGHRIMEITHILQQSILPFLQQYAVFIVGVLAILLLFKSRLLAKIYKVKMISPPDANKVLRQSLFLDIRSSREVENGPKIKGSKFVPLYQLSKKMDELKQIGTEKKVILVCHSGGRAYGAAVKLRKAGFTDVNILKGGLLAWKKEGYLGSKKKKKKSRK